MKQNYSGNKRRKEEARKKKQEEKRNKRLNASKAAPGPEAGTNPGEDPVGVPPQNPY